MKSLFSAALAPIGLAWGLAERHLWVSMALVTALALVGWMIGRPMATLGFSFVLGVLLMRADAILAGPTPAPLA
ncbi:hypothetical protein [Falsiroseomonas sp. CW058]|uniref:hypothetical protein n=1 Tax=Falsiroseomonas sp. CW058 TaxID=3388664 RepID=UPI003D30FD6E